MSKEENWQTRSRSKLTEEDKARITTRVLRTKAKEAEATQRAEAKAAVAAQLAAERAEAESAQTRLFLANRNHPSFFNATSPQSYFLLSP